MLSPAVFLLCLVGLSLLTGLPLLPRPGVRAKLRRAADSLAGQKALRPEHARDYVARIDGRKRETIFTRSQRRAKETYRATGQADKYQKTLKASVLCAAGGFAAGLAFRNPLLALVLGVGLYFIPLWASKFALYRYNRFLTDELEVALSLITTSYTRTNDIVGAVEENLPHINRPVREIFQAFVNNIRFVDPNAPAQIERMKDAIDNTLFRQWCDALILCQSDYSLRASLGPIVNKFADLKVQRMENDTKMMMPLRQALGMIALVVGMIPGLKLINADWYQNLMHTPPGQFSLALTAVVVLIAVNKAIELSEPIEFDV